MPRTCAAGVAPVRSDRGAAFPRLRLFLILSRMKHICLVNWQAGSWHRRAVQLDVEGVRALEYMGLVPEHCIHAAQALCKPQHRLTNRLRPALTRSVVGPVALSFSVNGYLHGLIQATEPGKWLMRKRGFTCRLKHAGNRSIPEAT